MARKFTILKVLIQTSNKGFTLIELIVGLLIFSIVGGLAMNALVQSSNSFSQDKQTIDSSQNLSAVLEIIGNDIRQAGELINDGSFPVVTISNPSSSTSTGPSTITIRKALAPTLTLCQSSVTPSSSVTSLVVSDDTQTTDTSCIPGTLSTNTLSLSTSGLTTTALGTPVSLPSALMTARNYRCQQDDPTVVYSNFSNTDFCLSTQPNSSEKVRAAMSDSSGNIWTFDYTNETTTTVSSKNKYSISISNPSTAPSTIYNQDTPIYLIEERVYTLNGNNLTLQINGGATQTLLTGISSFVVSARVYGDTTTKAPDAIDPSSTIAGTTNVLPLARRCDSSIAYYICNFKTSAYPSDNWKTLQGIKVKLQAAYNSAGKSTTPSQTDLDKLTATAEYFPRNVLSK